MAEINIENARNYLQDFDFQELFIEELGWSRPGNARTITEQVKDITYTRKAVAELSGVVIFVIETAEGIIPGKKEREAIAKEVQKQHFEHVLIFVDKDKKQSVWHWLKNQDKKWIPREHYFINGQPGDLFITKLTGLFADLSDFDDDGNISVADVGKKLRDALDIERVTKKFFKDYQVQHIAFLNLITGISDERQRRWYASVLLNRLMFIYFLQKKLFIDNKNSKYLTEKLTEIQNQYGKDKFYEIFLKKLFFEGFALPENERKPETNKLIGKIKYLNGGLFLKHKIELDYPDIEVPDEAFENLFGLFEKYSWTLDDTPGGKDDEINPDVLGYIFEKYINDQKSAGAYYTRPEITDYLCEQTVYKLILDEVNGPELDAAVPVKLKNQLSRRRYDSVAEMLLELDADVCKRLVLGDRAILKNLSLLDPACGSGAFLVAAMKTLINVYSATLGKIDFLGDTTLLNWKHAIEKDHPSINYFIKKEIITNNLYGVDIMEEATEIAKLRLFLALVASAKTEDQLEPLPNIDFNILSGNSLIGLLRVDDTRFNKNYQKVKNVKPGGGKGIQKDIFANPGLQTALFNEQTKGYNELILERERLIRSYKNAKNLGATQLQELRDSIRKQENEAFEILNQLLLEEFITLGIKYEKVTWDETKNKAGKPEKRALIIDDIQNMKPFHWEYEFSEIFRKKNGFDAIITNPPWEVFKPESKEFFLNYSDIIQKNKTNLEEFEKQMIQLLKNEGIRTSWLNFLSEFNHLVEYYRNANQFENQTSIINGKKAVSNNNLYKLFLEQSYNLLKHGGYCGIVIPSSIYTDMGSQKLRQMLFDKTKITGLYCFENRKEIFENVHRSFKFVVLSFEKGYVTTKFPAAFMKHEVSDLDLFPNKDSLQISTQLIEKLSPDVLSIFEFKNEFEVGIFEKIYKNRPLSQWKKIDLSREFNASDDDFRFNKKKNGYRIFEGKMIWHYTSNYSDNIKYISETELKKTHFNSKNDWHKARIAIRRVSANTNERTLVSTILPPNCLTTHSLFVNVNEILKNIDALFLISILNSYILDYIVRNQATTNITQFIIYSLPIIEFKSGNAYVTLVKNACRLICTTDEYAELWKEIMQSPWSADKAATTEQERNRLRAEIDGLVAHLYGLTEEEFTYILSTFPIVPKDQKDAALQAYKKLSTQPVTA